MSQNQPLVRTNSIGGAVLVAVSSLAFGLTPGFVPTHARAAALQGAQPAVLVQDEAPIRRRPLFDKSRCAAVATAMTTAWAPDLSNPQRGNIDTPAVSACPHFLSTLKLVQPHHRWRG